MQNLIRKILMSRVYEIIKITPLEFMPQLSQKLSIQNNQNPIKIWIKREDLQPVFSFKARGAYNKIANLTPEQLSKGVICASAGNHAQGVALSGQKLGIIPTIVMPLAASLLKVNACKARGAEVILHGDSFDDACAYAYELAEKNQKTFIHPYDDLDVIAGQGTIGKEIFEQNPRIDAIFVPIGGGGIAAGVAAYVKFIAPHCKVIGVEPEDAASMHDAIKANERVILKHVGVFADGVAVKQAGKHSFELCKQYLDDIILVSTDEICAAMKDIFEDSRAISEPSGALGLAGIKKYLAQNPNLDLKQIATILTGANINFDRLRHVAERAELGEKKEAILAVKIQETPGSFRNFIKFLGKRNITEFNYRYNDKNTATIFVGVNLTEGEKEKLDLIKLLENNGFEVHDLSENEIAKIHIRYMVGGKAQHVENESLFHFIFPERLGALILFLNGMSNHWNISLFHYRNHGSDYGRVLVGIQIPSTEKTNFYNFIDKLGYEYTEESNNSAYQLFL